MKVVRFDDDDDDSEGMDLSVDFIKMHLVRGVAHFAAQESTTVVQAENLRDSA